MRVLLTGASGFIGGHARRALDRAGYAVVPADRRHGVDFDRMLTVEDWLPHLRDVDAVINSVGIIVEARGQTFENLHQRAPAALFRACARVGVRRVVQISALGADERAFTRYQRSKKAADDVLRGLPLEWFVLRPSLVYGEGGASAAMFQRIARLPVLPLAGAGRQFVQPVHVDDLVATLLQCLRSASGRLTLDVVGPRPLTLAEWLRVIRARLGRAPAPILAVPWWLAMAFASVARFALPILHPDNLRMLRRGNTADVAPLTAFLGRPPIGVEDSP